MKLSRIFITLALCMQISLVQAAPFTVTITPSPEDMLQDGKMLIAQLTNNMTWIAAGTVVGTLGAGLAFTGITRMFNANNPDNANNPEHRYNNHYLTAIGLTTMATAACLMKVFLK